jgi:hypothetical protein
MLSVEEDANSMAAGITASITRTQARHSLCNSRDSSPLPLRPRILSPSVPALQKQAVCMNSATVQVIVRS